MHPKCLATFALPQNAIKPPTYDFVVQPRNGPETVIKGVHMAIQSPGSPKYTSHVSTRHLTEFSARTPGKPKA